MRQLRVYDIKQMLEFQVALAVGYGQIFVYSRAALALWGALA